MSVTHVSPFDVSMPKKHAGGRPRIYCAECREPLPQPGGDCPKCLRSAEQQPLVPVEPPIARYDTATEAAAMMRDNGRGRVMDTIDRALRMIGGEASRVKIENIASKPVIGVAGHILSNTLTVTISQSFVEGDDGE